MKKPVPSILLAIFVLAAAFQLPGCKSSDSSTYMGVKVPEIETALNDLMQNFYPRIIDTIHGGYWTNFEYDWTLSKDQDKMLVTQARGLWTASRAAQVFPDNKVYRKAADHGYEFLTQHMWDEQNGGFVQYYFTDSSTKTDPSFKLIYGNSFALYALSEYARINKSDSVLNWVKKTFTWLEENAHDPELLGYFNIVIPGQPVPPADSSASRRYPKGKLERCRSERPEHEHPFNGSAYRHLPGFTRQPCKGQVSRNADACEGYHDRCGWLPPPVFFP